MDIERARRLAEEGDVEAAQEYYRMALRMGDPSEAAREYYRVSLRSGHPVERPLALWLLAMTNDAVDLELAGIVARHVAESGAVSAGLVAALFDMVSVRMVYVIINLMRYSMGLSFTAAHLVREAVEREFNRRMAGRLDAALHVVRRSIINRSEFRAMDFESTDGGGISSIRCFIQPSIQVPEFDPEVWDPGDGYEYPEHWEQIYIVFGTSISFWDEDDCGISSSFTVSNYGLVDNLLAELFSPYCSRVDIPANAVENGSGTDEREFRYVSGAPSLSAVIEESFGFWDLCEEYFLRILDTHADRLSRQISEDIRMRCRRRGIADQIGELLNDHNIPSGEFDVLVGPYGEISARRGAFHSPIAGDRLFEISEEQEVALLEFLRRNEFSDLDEIMAWLWARREVGHGL